MLSRVDTAPGFASPPPPGTLERLEHLLFTSAETLGKLALAQTQTITTFEAQAAKCVQTLAAKHTASRLENSTNG